MAGIKFVAVAMLAILSLVSINLVHQSSKHFPLHKYTHGHISFLNHSIFHLLDDPNAAEALELEQGHAEHDTNDTAHTLSPAPLQGGTQVAQAVNDHGSSLDRRTPVEDDGVSQHVRKSYAAVVTAKVSGMRTAWDVSAVLAGSTFHSAGNDVAGVLRAHVRNVTVGGKTPATQCNEQRSGDKVKKVYHYNHRRRRKGELDEHEMYAMLVANGNVAGVVEMFPPLPRLVNSYPLSSTDGFDISKPWGSWKVAFLPQPDVVGFDKLRSPQRTDAQPPMYVAVLHDAILHQGFAISCRGREAFTTGACMWEYSSPSLVAANHPRVPAGVPLCDTWCKGYFHFTHEHLPRIALVHEALLNDRSLRLVLSHKPNGFQWQYFTDVLGIRRDQIAWGTAHAAVALYPMPMRCGNTFTHVLYMIRRIVMGRLGFIQPESDGSADGGSSHGNVEDGSVRPRHHHHRHERESFVQLWGQGMFQVLFAERSKLSRMPSNYHDLKEKLISEFRSVANFSTTQGSGGVRKQIGLFYHADLVIGPHGANLANMLWMRPATQVVEMMSAPKGNMCYYTTAGRLNITHRLILHGKGKDDKYTVMYDEFRKQFVDALAQYKATRGGKGSVAQSGDEDDT